MKLTVQSKFGEIYYYERSFVGTKVIKINGVELERINKYIFKSKKKKVEVEGNFLSGIGLYIDGQYVLIYDKAKWYEYLLSALPFLLLTIWGSVPYLVDIIPFAVGVMAGAINAVFAIVAIILGRTFSKFWQKLINVLIFVSISFLVCFLVGKLMY